MTKDALALPIAPDSWRAAEWQRLWLSARSEGSKTWRSLALVPASRGSSPGTMLQIAITLARTGMVHVGMPVHVADATGITLSQLEPFTEVLTQRMQDGDLLLIALSPLTENVTSLPLAKSADAALLCVVAGEMSLEDAKRTVAQVGHQRFIGSSLFYPSVI